uniref:Maturin n=1 Tax=Sus scrofa TaxID=9823 RepID=A0A8D1J185_PIG
PWKQVADVARMWVEETRAEIKQADETNKRMARFADTKVKFDHLCSGYSEGNSFHLNQDMESCIPFIQKVEAYVSYTKKQTGQEILSRIFKLLLIILGKNKRPSKGFQYKSSNVFEYKPQAVHPNFGILLHQWFP